MSGTPVALPVHCQFCHREVTVLYRPDEQRQTIVQLTCPWKDCRLDVANTYGISGVLLDWWVGHGPRPLPVWTHLEAAAFAGDNDLTAAPLWTVRKGKRHLRCTLALTPDGWLIRLTFRTGEPHRALRCASESDALETTALWYSEAIGNGWRRER